jgi:hypothetical protein
MALETSVSSYFNQLTRLVAREDFIIQCRRESSRSYIRSIVIKINKTIVQFKSKHMLRTLTWMLGCGNHLQNHYDVITQKTTAEMLVTELPLSTRFVILY